MRHAMDKEDLTFIQVPIYFRRSDLVRLSEWMAEKGQTANGKVLEDSARFKRMFDDGIKAVDGPTAGF